MPVAILGLQLDLSPDSNGTFSFGAARSLSQRDKNHAVFFILIWLISFNILVFYSSIPALQWVLFDDAEPGLV